MDYKKVLKTTGHMLSHPAMAWRVVSHSGAVNVMLGEFFYPLVMLCGTALLLGRLFSNGMGWESMYVSMISAALCSVSLLLAYHAIVPLVAFFTAKYTGEEYRKDHINLFVGYSMVVILVLKVCLGLFPELALLAFIAQFYTLKIVWDGASVLMKIDEQRRLAYVVVVSLIIILMPTIISKLMGYLSVVLK